MNPVYKWRIHGLKKNIRRLESLIKTTRIWIDKDKKEIALLKEFK